MARRGAAAGTVGYVLGRLLAVALLVVVLPLVAAAPAGGAPGGPTWRPDVSAAKSYAAKRAGVISFAVRTPRSLYGSDARRGYRSASIVKPMLLLAYLNGSRVRDRSLRERERSMLSLLIRHSSNRLATRVRDRVGNGALERLAARAGMRDFATAPSWGSTRITAADQARLFLAIDRLTVARHRAFAMRLLGSIVRSQRWGVTEAAPAGWLLFFKSGWLKATEHQVALLRRGDRRVAISILSAAVPLPSHEYAKQTLAGVAKRLLRGLGPGSIPR